MQDAIEREEVVVDEGLNIRPRTVRESGLWSETSQVASVDIFWADEGPCGCRIGNAITGEEEDAFDDRASLDSRDAPDSDSASTEATLWVRPTAQARPAAEA